MGLAISSVEEVWWVVAVAPSQVIVDPLLLTAPVNETEEPDVPDAGGGGGFAGGSKGGMGGACWLELAFWLGVWLAFWRWWLVISGRSRPWRMVLWRPLQIVQVCMSGQDLAKWPWVRQWKHRPLSFSFVALSFTPSDMSWEQDWVGWVFWQMPHLVVSVGGLCFSESLGR